MSLRAVAVCVVFALTVTNGAVLPHQDDALFETIQSFLVEPEEFATSLGMTRVKRSAYDKDVKISALGLHIQVKYNDPNNQLKGGDAVITIDDLQKIIKRAKSKRVQLKIKFNPGNNPRDGIFTLDVEYDLQHAINEKGKLHINRAMSGGKYIMDVSNTQIGGSQGKILPGFELKTKSDRKTFLEGTYKASNGQTYKIDVKRTPGKKIHAVIDGAGKKYIVDGNLDKANKAVTINIDAAGKKYTITGNLEDTATNAKVKGNINLGGAGSYDVELDAKKDFSSVSFKVLFNNNNFANLKLLSKKDKDGTMKSELRYSLIGLGDGKVRVSFKDGQKKELKVQYLPKTGLDLKLTLTRELHADQSRHIVAEVTRGGEKYIGYKNDIVPKSTPAAYTLNIDSELDLSEKSLVHAIFCKYGCFKHRTMHAQLYVDNAKPYKFSLDVQLTKDKNQVLTMEINSRNNPYIFNIKAPRILPKILPTGRESIEFEADHKPGQYLKVKSNTDIIKTFSVEKISGDQRKITLNGKELVRGSLAQGQRSISQTTTLPDGRSLTTTISWETDNLKKNTVNIKLDGTERNLDAKLRWDSTKPGSFDMHADAKGENKRWGKYKMTRNAKVNFKNGKIDAKIDGVTDIANAPWPSPVNTDIKADINTKTADYSITINKTVAGNKYGITIENGKMRVNL